MSRTLKIGFGVIAGLCVLLSCLLLSECQKSSDLERDAEAMQAFYENEKNQIISRDSIEAQQLIDMKQNLMSEIAAREILEEEFERFKEIQSHVRFESVTRVDTLRIPYMVPGVNILADYTDYIPVDSVKKHFVQVPQDLVYNDDWFKFHGTVDQDHFMIDSMNFVNKFDVTIGTKKSDKPLAFLRKKEYVVELVSYNPYTSVNYVNNIIVDQDKKEIKIPVVFTAGAITMFLGFKLIQ